MLKYGVVPILMSLVILSATAAESNISRNKRQAPNINVHDFPKTSFSCENKKIGEYYADQEANCQVYHVCIPGMNNRLSLISFACPNGTIFSQATKVCTPYERVDCRLTSQFFRGGAANNNLPSDYESDDYDNYVPPPSPPRPQPQPPRQSAPSRNRNTPAPPPPPSTTQQPRNNRFRSGSNQFRGQQAAPATTRAPPRAASTVQPPLPVRGAIPVSARPAPTAFRPPVLAARPPQGGAVLANALPQRPTPRSVVSTSTSSYNYEYEYEYDYEDETGADQANARSKREAISSDYIISPKKNDEKILSFTCEDKVVGAAYADVKSNCEMFHICVLLGKHRVLDYKVNCAEGKAFDQEKGSCRDKEDVVCENSHLFYQFEKMNPQASNKKAVISKKKSFSFKKATPLVKE